MSYIKKFICILAVFLSCSAFSAQLNPKEWVVFIKSYSTEQFSVNFPDDPEFFSRKKEGGEDKLFFANSASGGVNYSIQVIPNASKDFLTDYVSSIKNQSDIEMKTQAFFKGQNYRGVDVAYIDKSSSRSIKTRTVTTQKNTYILNTTSNVGEKDDHSYFISSFNLLS